MKLIGKRWMTFADHLTGVNRSRTTLHAITFHEVANQKHRLTCPSVCGRRVYVAGQPAVVDGKSDGGVTIPWPPFARSEGMERCRECWVATGKHRPDERWRAAS